VYNSASADEAVQRGQAYVRRVNAELDLLSALIRTVAALKQKLVEIGPPRYPRDPNCDLCKGKGYIEIPQIADAITCSCRYLPRSRWGTSTHPRGG